MKAKLMAIVAEGPKGRIFLAPTEDQEKIATSAMPVEVPDSPLPEKALGFRIQEYGMLRHRDLFTDRQLTALTTFSNLVQEVIQKIKDDALKAKWETDSRTLDEGGSGVTAYAESVAIYLGMLIGQLANHGSSICGWNAPNTQMRSVFSRQAIPMVWDYAEANPFSDSSGSFNNLHERQVKGVQHLYAKGKGKAYQQNAIESFTSQEIISTDPPYYDNIGYADLSDFFYIWLRRTLRDVVPSLFGAMLVPKNEELVAEPYRHGDKRKAEKFFLNGMTAVMERMADVGHPAFPATWGGLVEQERIR